MPEERKETKTRVAIVTGGSRGIGRAVVEALLGEGWRVHFCSRSAESVETTLAELAGRFGGAVQGKPVDVRHEGEVDFFVRGVAEAEGGRIECLVNNAGLGIFGPVDELSGDAFREVIETNLLGPFYFLRAVARVMKPRGEGWIFNIASLAGKNPMAGGAAYNASKFGLVGFSEASMLDLRQSGIRVASILPGSVDTDFGHPGHPGGGGGTGESWRLKPQDIAAMILHLLTYPPNALPSLVEMRPARPPKK
ncbi:MAG TPA: SDR family NAD(P)-dependent oxidoreductase [Thermoanaerobaculia bacterium]|nr:SDR family NAD(P)-dependent oxidoreductase [Thermoanaerobaculia bacterium]